MEIAPRDNRVTSLELFFDLVFVFALTQVTAFMAEDLTGRGILRGVLILAVLWWSWTGYAWLSNVVRADAGVARIASLIAMIAMFGSRSRSPRPSKTWMAASPALCWWPFATSYSG
jgi:low temperature requirement protein LtrA